MTAVLRTRAKRSSGRGAESVVYQWEARTRTPSPLFWQRITALHRRLPERPEAGTHR